MKLGITMFGTALAGAALLAAVASPAQDSAAGKPAAGKPKPGQVKAQPNAQTAPATKPAAKPPAKTPAKPPAKPAAKPEAEPAAEPSAEDKPGVSTDQDDIVAKRFAKASTPAEQHEWLAGFAGKWKMVSRYMIMPDTPAVESTGTSEFKMLMDGRFLVESQDANGGAGPFKGMGVVGFNTLTGKAERVWFDTTSTGMVKSEGDLLADRNEIRWVDTWIDPLANEVRSVTSILRKVSDTEFTFQQTNEYHGQTFKSLVISYRKA